MKQYVRPAASIILFDDVDVIVTSGDDTEDDEFRFGWNDMGGEN